MVKERKGGDEKLVCEHTLFPAAQSLHTFSSG